MASGKQIGTFSLTSTSTTIRPGAGDALHIEGNMEGPVTGDMAGNGVATLHVDYVPGTKTGEWHLHGFVALTAGPVFGFHSLGTWEEIAPATFRYRGTGKTSDGMSYAVEFENDPAARTFAGTLHE